MARTEPGVTGKGAQPGLVLHVGPRGPGAAKKLWSWRTGDWDALTLADLAPLGRDPVVAGLLARWQAVHAAPSAATASPPWPDAARPWLAAKHRLLWLDQPDLPRATRRQCKRAVQAAYPGSALITLPHQADPMPWFTQASVVCTHSAAEGMLALLAGATVHAWGMPFYAGWGLTRDELPAPPTRGAASLLALFEAVALRRSAYADLGREGHGSLATVLDAIALQTRVQARFADLGRIEARGLARWKRPFVAPFLQAGGHAMAWQSRLSATAGPSPTVALWGATPRPDELGPGKRVVRVEDGFIRSAGLGSDLIAPRSLVIDRAGIYFDAHGGSELLNLLQTEPVSPALVQRAAALRQLMVDKGISKYNFARQALNWRPPEGQPVVLVIGQVADDAAMRLGVGTGEAAVTTAEQLLQRVRAEQPQAHLVYKPHPDVLSGNRQGLIGAQALCDRVDAASDLISLIEVADEVHVISSLAGLDALLRGKHVVTHGLPFFAGWGLTTDRCKAVPPRQRTLQLDELLALTLLVYPVYWDWEWGMFTTAEATARHLANTLHEAPLPGPGQATSRTLTKTKRWLRNLLSASA